MSTRTQALRRYHLVYQITHIDSQMMYIGCHSTDNIDDGYMGSGFRLRKAIQKYGKERFRRDVLFVYDTPAAMFSKEKELVNEDFIARVDTYNIVIGGGGGPNKGIIGQRRMYHPVSGKRIVVHGSAVPKMLVEGFQLKSGWATHAGKKYMHKDNQVISVSPEEIDGKCADGWNQGLPKSPTAGHVWIYHSVQDKYSLCKSSEIDFYLLQGWIRKKWAPFTKGTSCWINDGQINQRIKKQDLEQYLKLGWTRGAIQKH